MLRENLRYLILSGAIVLAALIYACANRYQVVFDPTYSRTFVVDKWTGSINLRR